jgi:hypothetical protein
MKVKSPHTAESKTSAKHIQALTPREDQREIVKGSLKSNNRRCGGGA